MPSRQGQRRATRQQDRAHRSAGRGNTASLGPAPASRTLLAIVAVALVLKVIVLAQLASHPLLQPRGVLDDAVYVRLAERVASGDLALGPSVYFLSPLYSYFLGAIFAAGGTIVTARIVQIVLGSVAVWLVGLTAGRWFGRAAGIAAAACAAATGFFTFNEILLLQSSLDPFLSALALLALAVALQTGRVPASALAGAAFGLLSLNRPNALAAAAIVAITWLALKRSRAGLTQVAAFALGLALLLAPVAIRNRVVAGEWVLLTSHGGLNFYIGNHEGADGLWTQIPGISPSIEGQAADAAGVASTALGHRAGAAETSSYFYGIAWRWLREHPGDGLVLLLRKLLLTFNATDLALNYSYTYYARDEPTLLALLVVGPWLLVPLGLFGLCLPLLMSDTLFRESTGFRLQASGFRVQTPEALPEARSPKPEAGAYLTWAAFVLAYALSVAIFFVSSRYRLPLLIALCVGSGASLAWLRETVASRSWRRARAAIAAVAVLVVLTLWPLSADDGRMYERTERIVFLLAEGRDADAERLLAETEPRHPQRALLLYRVGRAHEDRHDAARAVSYFEKALAANQGQMDVRFSLGKVLLDAGRPADALPHLQAAREAGVEPNTAAFLLSRAHLALGHRDEARLALRQVQLPSDADAEVAAELGRFALQLDEPSEAERFLRHAIASGPPNAEWQEMLGVAVDRLGRDAEAAIILERAVSLDAARPSSHFYLALAYAQLGRLEDAWSRVAEALRLSPDHAGALRLRGELEKMRSATAHPRRR